MRNLSFDFEKANAARDAAIIWKKVEVNATKYTSYNAYITVDAPENIEVYPGTLNTPLQLTAGVATTIEMTSNNNYINVRPTTDCSIVSIQVNGVEYGTVNGYGTSGTTIRNINENDQIVITTKKIALRGEFFLHISEKSCTFVGS